MELDHISTIRPGASSYYFPDSVDETRCFAIIGQHSTFHFQAQTKELADFFVKGLCTLVHDHHIKTGTFKTSRGSVITDAPARWT